MKHSPVSIERLAVVLLRVARAHHNTVTPSKLHQPSKTDFWACPCFTCIETRLVLDDCGIERAVLESQS